jgi:hypothetical protein
MKTSIVQLITIASFGISMVACGSSGGGDNSTSSGTGTNANTSVTVERGAIFGATVTDSSSPAQTATATLNSNVYTFAKAPIFPVNATGGYIDVDNDGIITPADAKLNMDLKSYSYNVTPVTTYIADVNKTLRDTKLNNLVTLFSGSGISAEDLLQLPSQAKVDSIILNNAIYQQYEESGVSVKDINETELNSTIADIKIFISQKNITEDSNFANNLEKELIQELKSNDKVESPSDTEISKYDNSFGHTGTSTEPQAHIDVRELSGYTVVTDPNSATYKTISYIFSANLQVELVYDRKDGGQEVYNGTYEIRDTTSQVYMLFTIDPTNSIYKSYSLFYDSEHLIYTKEYISLGLTITKIIANADNGITFPNNQADATAFTVNTANDIKGYTITSNNATGEHEQVTFNCDGSSDFSSVYAGQVISSHEDTTSIVTYDNVSYSLSGADVLFLLTTDMQLVPNETCWSSTNSDGTCYNNLKIATITQDSVCQ